MNYSSICKIFQRHCHLGIINISKRLYNDLGSDIKLLKAVPLALSSKNAKAMQQEWKEKTQNIDTKSNEIVFCVSAKNQIVARKLLEKQNVNYIIFD